MPRRRKTGARVLSPPRSPDAVEALQNRRAVIHRVRGFRALVGRAERLGFGPGEKGVLVGPERVGGIKRRAPSTSPAHQVEADEAGDGFQMAVAGLPHRLEGVLLAGDHAETVHGQVHGRRPSVSILTSDASVVAAMDTSEIPSRVLAIFGVTTQGPTKNPTHTSLPSWSQMVLAKHPSRDDVLVPFGLSLPVRMGPFAQAHRCPMSCKAIHASGVCQVRRLRQKSPQIHLGGPYQMIMWMRAFLGMGGRGQGGHK
jgi:hypothetical protein